jgi:hypothetical protein
MRAPGDATSALLRAIVGRFPDHRIVVEEIRSRSWASATFSGSRHELSLRVEGDGADGAADRFLGGLEGTEFEMRGHIMADIALVSEGRRDGGACVTICLEALTVADD